MIRNVKSYVHVERINKVALEYDFNVGQFWSCDDWTQCIILAFGKYDPTAILALLKGIHNVLCIVVAIMLDDAFSAARSC